MRDIGDLIPAHKTIQTDCIWDEDGNLIDPGPQPPPPWYRHAWEVIKAMATLPVVYLDEHAAWYCTACEVEEPAAWSRQDGEPEEDRAYRVIPHDKDCPVLLARKLWDEA